MTNPAPAAFGRNLVVAPDAPAGATWADAPRHRLDAALLADPLRAGALADALHEAWAARRPYVVELAVDAATLREPERVVAPPWEVGADHLFARERLQYLVWVNSVDARTGTPIWWWSHKAAALGAEIGGPADVLLPDGTPAWVDGGPRGPVPDAGHPVVHGESVRSGSLRPMPATDPEPPPGAFDPGQLDAVVHRSGPARVIAPAGSGKTRTLIGRIHHLLARGVEPRSILAVAYNRRARDELVERLPTEARGVDVRTIHSLGWSILRQAEPSVRLLEEREVRRVLDRLVPARHQSNTDRLGPYLEALTAVRVGFRDPEEVDALRDDAPDFALVLRRYRDRLQGMRAADHEEQVLGAIEVLLADPALRAERQARHRHVLVDEFQDLTPAYLLLLRLVAAPELAVFGVGDDDQTIYGYSGADPEFLIDYGRWFPGADAHALATNYRSVAPIVRTAATLLTHNRRRVDKEIVAADETEPDDAVAVRTVPGSELAVRGAAQLAAWLEAGETEVVVLARVHAALLPLHLACQEAAVPTRVELEPGFLDRTGVASALAWLRVGRNPESIAADDLYHTARRPPSGIVGLLGEVVGNRDTSLRELQRVGRTLDGRQAAMWWKFIDRLERVARMGRAATTADLLDAVVDDEGLATAALKLDHSRPAGAGGHTDDLTALVRAAELHPDPDTLGEWLAERLGRPPAPDAIRLTTVHKVKGLEWDRVLVFGVDDGTLPHRLSDDLEEERRVLHVAITRARRQVVVMADAARPSPFLPELERERGPDERPPVRTGGAGTRKGVRVSVGDRVTASGGYRGEVVEVGDEWVLLQLGEGGRMRITAGELVRVGSRSGPLVLDGTDVRERLKRLRSEEASRRDVPAYVIFNDRTLDALCEARPTSRTELLTIPGIGPAKLESYGDQILAAISDSEA
ncbi:MAG: UvrD-helicase domain-containing protein [Acidimicrobiia bacterium]